MGEFIDYMDKNHKELHKDVSAIWKRERDGLKFNRTKLQRVVQFPVSKKKSRREGSASNMYR